MKNNRQPPRFPRSYRIDYSGLCRTAGADTIDETVELLRRHLPVKWAEIYSVSTSHPTNLVNVKRGSFEYLYDFYSGLEALGEIAFDQRLRDRVVGVFGYSSPRRGPRHGSLLNGCLDMPEELVWSPRDKGHFIAHSIGGGLDLNVFLQDRALNRGYSEAGKLYRDMESYCRLNPGTFCFSRPIYTDTSSVPHWLEFGLVRQDGSVWVEVFEN